MKMMVKTLQALTFNFECCILFQGQDAIVSHKPINNNIRQSSTGLSGGSSFGSYDDKLNTNQAIMIGKDSLKKFGSQIDIPTECGSLVRLKNANF